LKYKIGLFTTGSILVSLGQQRITGNPYYDIGMVIVGGIFQALAIYYMVEQAVDKVLSKLKGK